MSVTKNIKEEIFDVVSAIKPFDDKEKEDLTAPTIKTVGFLIH